MRRIPVADAPVNWGIYDHDPRRPPAVPADAFLDHVVDAGYDGIELGPPGFLGDADGTRARLAGRGLMLVGAFLDLRFSRPEVIADELRALSARARFVARAAPAGATPMAVLSDATAEPDRLAVACRAAQHPGTWLPANRFEALVANIHRAAEICRQEGLVPVVHPHAGGYIETDREIRAVCDRLDPALVGLCLDTGHVRLGEGDPVALLRDYRPLVKHVHLKDVDTTVLERSRSQGLAMDETWALGIFTSLGSGDVPIAAIVANLVAADYDGWVVVEQDRVRQLGETPDVAATAVRHNREALIAMGLSR